MRSRSSSARRARRRHVRMQATTLLAIVLLFSPGMTWATQGPECCAGTVRGQVVGPDSDQLSKQAPATPLAPGDTSRFMVTFSPGVPGPSWVEDRLPAEINVVGGVRCSTGSCRYDASRNTVRWDSDSGDSGPVTIDYQGMVRADVSSDRVVTHHVHASSGIVAEPTTRIVVCSAGQVLDRASGRCRSDDSERPTGTAKPAGSSAGASGLRQAAFWTSGAILALILADASDDDPPATPATAPPR